MYFLLFSPEASGEKCNVHGEHGPRGVTATLGLFCAMNIPTHLMRDIQFRSLRRKLGPIALEALVYLGLFFQSTRMKEIRLSSPEDLIAACDLEDQIDPQLLWDSLVGTWLIEQSPGSYSFPFFEDNNRQLRSLWNNGKKLQQSTEQKRTELNSIEENRNEVKRTELNRIELNRTRCLGNARAMPWQRLGNAYPNGPIAEDLPCDDTSMPLDELNAPLLRAEQRR